jgi:hypothetical protein
MDKSRLWISQISLGSTLDPRQTTSIDSYGFPRSIRFSLIILQELERKAYLINEGCPCMSSAGVVPEIPLQLLQPATYTQIDKTNLSQTFSSIKDTKSKLDPLSHERDAPSSRFPCSSLAT